MRSRVLIILLLLSALGGCATMTTERQTASSLVEFLYPGGQPRPLAEETANLKLPVKVGLVFVPNSKVTSHGNGMANNWVATRTPVLSMADETALLDSVAGHFRKYPFIKTVEVIPDVYLTPGGGFQNLDALSAMYDVDIVALVSYDQVQNTDEGFLSLSYLTIVGAYMVEGERNSTTTFVDTAVFDLKSRKLLFRAPGISSNKGSATLVNNSEGLRDDSHKGFEAAFIQMTTNLDDALTGFKQKVKDNPSEFKVSAAPGYAGSGGGAYGWWLLASLAGLLLVRRRWGRA